MRKVKPTTKADENEKKTRFKRGENPKSLANLQKFSSDNQPASNGRPPGTPNRATVIEKFMNHPMEVADPSNKSVRLKVTMYEAAMLGQFRAAMGGSTQAWKEIQDALWGKMPDKTELELGGSVEQSITFKRAKDVNSTDEDN